MNRINILCAIVPSVEGIPQLLKEALALLIVALTGGLLKAFQYLFLFAVEIFGHLHRHTHHLIPPASTVEIGKALPLEAEDIARLGALLDGVFDAPVCDAVFGGMNIYAMASGLPAWVNLMLAVMDECDTTFSREQKATNPRIAKYTAKWSKYKK